MLGRGGQTMGQTTFAAWLLSPDPLQSIGIVVWLLEFSAFGLFHSLPVPRIRQFPQVSNGLPNIINVPQLGSAWLSVSPNPVLGADWIQSCTDWLNQGPQRQGHHWLVSFLTP